MEPFAIFDTTNYTFLQLESKAGGNVIVQEFSANGIVKLRDGFTQADNIETYGEDTVNALSTVHIRPTESFIATLGGNLIGHGIRVAQDGSAPLEYRIIGQVIGRDYDLGIKTFYRVTLKRENLWQDESDLPLE